MRSYNRNLKPTMLLIFTLFLLSSELSDAVAQDNHYFFNVVDSTEAYLSTGFCKTLNYYWDQGIIDSKGNIYFIFVDNYKVFYHVSSDVGLTWESHHVVTPQDGHIYTAMVALTQDDSLVIVYSANMGFNNGTVTYGSEFSYDLYGAVQRKDSWDITPLKMHPANNGLLPYGTITVKSGLVHVITYKYGWYNYGGELYEFIYDPSTMAWQDMITMKIFNDRNVDHSTFHVCKLAEGENDSIICVYQRHNTDTKYGNLEVMMKGEGGWTEEEIILENSNYNTYNKFDLDYDRHGHMYLAYFIPYGDDGPELYLAHNSVREFEKFTPFSSSDTLQKISIHPYPDAVAYLYMNFKNAMPEIWKLSEEGLEETNFLPDYNSEDSLDVMRFHYQIPIKNNFSVLPNLPQEDNQTGPGLFAFTNRGAPRDGSTVLEYPLIFVKTNMEYIAPDSVPGEIADRTLFIEDYYLYPNPGNGEVYFRSGAGDIPESIRVYNATGCLVKEVDLEGGNYIILHGLTPGLYFLTDPKGLATKYILN